MATTVKELIEILKKYEDPDEVVIWQYYTRHEFDYLNDDDHCQLSKEDFAKVADIVGEWDIWEGISDSISEAVWQYEEEKGQK